MGVLDVGNVIRLAKLSVTMQHVPKPTVLMQARMVRLNRYYEGAPMLRMVL